jgi:hypothetical protein
MKPSQQWPWLVASLVVLALAAACSGADEESRDAGGDSGQPADDAGPGGDADQPDGAPSSESDGQQVDGRCSGEVLPNEDRESAADYALGTELEACLQAPDDIDFYAFTAPGEPMPGGDFVVQITQVGDEARIEAIVEAVADDGDIQRASAARADSVFLWFNAKAGAAFRLKVVQLGAADYERQPYTLKIDYTGLPDEHEPNDVRAEAAAMSVDAAVQGYMFGGYENATAIAAATWEDWFRVTLAGGMATITLSELASDMNGSVTLYDASGTQLASEAEVARGSSVVLMRAVMAGEHYVKVRPRDIPATRGSGSVTPSYLTQPYTLTATVE